MINKIKTALLTGVVLSTLPAVSYAQETLWGSKSDIEAFLENMQSFIWGIAAIIIVIFLIYAGFLFVTAAGSDDQIKKAKDMVKYALIGVVVMILAASVMGVMTSFLRT